MHLDQLGLITAALADTATIDVDLIVERDQNDRNWCFDGEAIVYEGLLASERCMFQRSDLCYSYATGPFLEGRCRKPQEQREEGTNATSSQRDDE